MSLGKDRALCLDGFLLPGHVSVVIGVEATGG
jgi:hydrogenase maturation factor